MLPETVITSVDRLDYKPQGMLKNLHTYHKEQGM